MKNLIELFPVLTEREFAGDDPRLPLLDAPGLLAGARPVPHLLFQLVRSQLFSSVKSFPLTLLLGVTGVGKSRLVALLVERINGMLAQDGRIPGVYLVAPTAQRTVFSWKAFWERLLSILEDPLPQHKIHPQARAEALRSDGSTRMRKTTESQYFEMVLDAAARRGLLLLVIDEAIALARSESGRTLYDQINVLRELADTQLFQIVLASTFEILPHFRRSGVLARRLGTVVFPHYAEVLTSAADDARASSQPSRSIDLTDEGYLAFARSVRTFMERLPDFASLDLRDEHFVELYRGSLGCVGLLHDWFLRAVAMCVESGEHRLQWKHFDRTCLNKADRAQIIVEAREAEAQLAVLQDRGRDLTETSSTSSVLSSRIGIVPSGPRGARPFTRRDSVFPKGSASPHVVLAFPTPRRSRSLESSDPVRCRADCQGGRSGRVPFRILRPAVSRPFPLRHARLPKVRPRSLSFRAFS